MMSEMRCGGGAGRLGRRWLAAAALLLAPLAACDVEGLLDVDAPGQIPADRLEDPQYAGLLVNGAAADFECAIGAFVLVGGIMGDELADAQLGSTAWWYDRRDAGTQTGGAYGVNGCDANQTPGIYRPLSTARWAADNALRNLEGWTDAQVPQRASLIATAATYAGFSYAMLGMSMCSAAVDSGPELTSQQLFALAEQRFATAIEAGTRAGSAAMVHAARVGRARVRLYQGNRAGAAEDARQVPADFVLNATASQDNNRRYNRLFAANVLYGYYTVEPHSRGLTTGGVEDPRTATAEAGRLAADGTPLWVQRKYTDYGTPIPIATGDEARLILAEAEGGETAVGVINALRDRAGVPRFEGGDDAAISAALVEERRRELWLEGQRMYDIRRFEIPQLPAPGTPFAKGGSYGTTTCLPLPDVERFNNPSL